MEFHSATLLPKGLPDIMAAVTPYDFYPEMKVIAFRRKDKKGICGRVRSNHMTNCLEIYLYPTVCCSGAGPRHHVGTLSFELWMSLLKVALHEIGHLATIERYYHLARHPATDRYIENLAEDWMHRVLARILRDDPRLGQPVGALTGYPGAIAYRGRNWGRPWNGEVCYKRIKEWRALGCDGQITMFDIACKLKPGLYSPPCDLKQRARIYRLIHQAAEAVGVRRFFVNRNGRRYLMFNVGETDAVWNWLSANVERVDRAIGKDGIEQEWDKEVVNFTTLPELDPLPF